MSISSNRLFHFTDRNSLLNILENNFIPYFSMEKILSGEMEVAVPMVSFCDIPLSQVKDHIKEYGKYAIGLSKEWGIKNNLSPVFYNTHSSKFEKKVQKALREALILASETGGFLLEKVDDMQLLLTYIYYSKPYKGSNWDKKNKKFKSKNRTLYNEREWRYIPPENSREQVNFIFKEFYLNDSFIVLQKNLMRNKILSFKPNDIKYIIVNKESEIPNIIEAVELIKSKYSPEEIKLLISRIISLEQIVEDF